MFDLTNDLNAYLVPHERVLWQGQGTRRLSTTALAGFLFAGLFIALAALMAEMFTTIPARSRGSDPFVLILPIIFLAVGLGVGIPWVVMGNQVGKARYYVTNASAFMVYAPATGTRKRVTVVALRNLQQLTLNENSDGTGTLTFAASPYAMYGRYSSGRLLDWTPTFANIERPLEVYQLIRRQMEELNSA